MEFDPTKPFEVISGPEVEFDPSAPFEIIDPVASTQEEEGPNYSDIRSSVFDFISKDERISKSSLRNEADDSSGFLGGMVRRGKNLLGDTVSGVSRVLELGLDKVGMDANNEYHNLEGILNQDNLRLADGNRALNEDSTAEPTGTVGKLVRMFEDQGIIDGEEMSRLLKDSVKENMWDSSTDDDTRVLSDGSVRVNPSLLMDKDKTAGLTAIKESGGTEEQKKLALEVFPLARAEAAKAMDARFRIYNDDYREHARKSKGKTPEEVLFSWDGLDRNVIEDSWDFVRDVAAQSGRNTYNALVRTPALGIANVFGADEDAARISRDLIESGKKSQYANELGFARGQGGLVMGTGKELATTVLDMIPMFTGAKGGRMIAGKEAKNVVRQKLGSITAAGSVYGYGGMQGYASVMQTALQKAEETASAEGRKISDEDMSEAVDAAQGPALANAFQTMLLMKIKPGGVEHAAFGGLTGGQITGKEMLSALKDRYGASGWQKAVMSMAPEISKFSKQALKATKEGFKDEAIEEGVNQYLEGMITKFSGVDSDMSFDQIGQDTFKGTWMGGVVGGGFSAAQSVFSTHSDSPHQMTINPTEALAQQVAADGLPSTAAAMRTATLQAPAPTSAAADSGVMRIPSGKKDTTEIPVSEQSGAGLAAKFFGDAPAGREYDSSLDPSQFSLEPLKGGDGLMAIKYKGQFTNRAYNPATGQGEVMSEAASKPLRAKQEGSLMWERGAPTVKIEADEVASTQTSESAVTKLPEEAPDEIDLSPTTNTNEKNQGQGRQEGLLTSPDASVAPAAGAATPKSNEQNTQGSSGPEVQAPPQVPVRTVPTGAEAQSNPESAGVVPKDAPAPQKKAEAPIAQRFTEARSQAGALPDSSGRLNASVEAADAVLGTSSMNAEETRYNPSSRNLDINAGTATSVAVENASIDALADKTDVDAAPLIRRAGKEARQMMQDNHPEADEAQLGRLLVGAAINGNGAALAAIRKSGQAELAQQVAEKMAAHGLSGDLGKSVTKAISRFTSKPLASVSPAPNTPNTPNTGGISISKADATLAIQVDKGSEYVDSGPRSDHHTIAESPSINAIVTTVDDKGNAIEQRRVMFTEALSNGGVRHHLKKVIQSKTEATAKSYAPNEKVLTATRGMVKKLKLALTQDYQALHPKDRQALLDVTRLTVQAQLGQIASPELATAKLSFGSTDPGILMAWNQGKIEVNENNLLDQFLLRVKDIPVDNEVALEGAARDYAQFLSATVFHELKHDLIDQVTTKEDRIASMREMVDMASLPGLLRDTLLSHARTQIGQGFLARAEYGAMVDQSYSTLPDGQLMALLDGTDSRMTPEALDETLDTIAHEMLVEMTDRMMTGTTYDESLQNLSNWVARFVNPDSTPKQLTRLQSLMARLSEMANRLASAISNFFAAHRLAAQLPPSLYDASLALQAAMEAGGFKAPDVHNIQARAMQDANDRLARISRSARKYVERDIVEAQKNLRHAIGMYQARGEPNPVTLNPITGTLTTKEDNLKDLVSKVNENFDGAMILSAASTARDLSLVLKHLNAGRSISPNSKIVDTFDPARIEESSTFIRESVRRGVETASGMTEDVLVSALNAAQAERYSDLYTELGPAFTSLTDLFTTGTLNAHDAGAAAAERLLEAEQSLSEAAMAHDLGATEENWKARKAAEEELFQSRSALTQVVDELLTHASDPRDPYYDRALILKEKVEDNRRMTRSAISRHEQSKALVRPIRSIDDAIAFNARHPEEMDGILRTSSLADGKVKSALSEGHATIEAIGRLKTFPEQLDYLAMGGRRPNSLRRPDASGWQNVNAVLDKSRRLLPLPMGRMLRSGATSNVEAAQAIVEGSLNEPQWRGEVEAGHVSFTYSPTNFFSEAELADQDFAKAFITGDTFVVPTRNAMVDARSVLYAPLLNALSTQVEAASQGASRLLGLEAINTDRPLSGYELNERVKENVRSLNAPLIEALQDEHWRMGNVSTEVMQTGGFAEDIETREDGTKRIRFADKAVVMPDVGDVLTSADVIEAISTGAFGDLLASTHNFTTRMEGRVDGVTAPILSHDQGLTSAGLAYQAIIAKEIQFLALTKGLVLVDKNGNGSTRVDEAIIAASSDPKATAAAYNSLAPDFENALGFKAERAELARNPFQLIKRFWDLHRAASAANTIHGDTLTELHNRSRMRAELEAREGEYRLPVSTKAAEDVNFNQTLRRHLIPDPAKTRAPKGTLVSLFQTNSAQSLIDEGLFAQQEVAQLVGHGHAVDELGQPTNDPAFVQRVTDDPRNKDGRFDSADNNERQFEQAARDEKFARERLETWRYSALAAILGGHQETIMNLIHSPEFSTPVVNEQGERVMSYHSEKLDGFIMDELGKLREEEIARGTVVGPDKLKLDSALDHDLVFDDDGSIKDPGGLRQRNQGFDDVIDSLIQTGATTSRVLDPGLVRLDRSPGFESTPQSVMTSLFGRIDGGTVLTGRARWDGAKDSDAKGKVKPTVVFIPDASAPTLVFPYGNNVAVDEQDARKAVTAMLKWQGDHGGVDIQAEASRLLEPIRDRRNDMMGGEIKSAFRSQLGEILTDSGTTLDELQDARIENYAEFWTLLMDQSVQKALNATNDPSSVFFDPRQESNVSTNEQAAEVLALALTQPQLKKVLLLSMTKDPELPYPLPWAMAEHGDLASTGNIPGALDHFMEARLQELPSAIKMTDERGVEVKTEDEADFFSVYAQSDIDWDATFGESGITEEQAIDLGATPIMHQQMQWLNNLLYDVMSHLQPSSSAEGLAGAPDQNRGLTEMESRQLMATLPPEHISKRIAEAEKRREAQWNDPDRGGALSVDAIMRVTGEIANELRADYDSWALLDGPSLMESSEFVARQMENVGPYSLMDTIRGEGTDHWHQTRLRKGALRYAQLYGAEMMKSESGTYYGQLEADPREMERRAIAGGWAQYTEVLNEDGSRERVTIHEAAIREFERQKTRDAAILKNAQDQALRRADEVDKAVRDLRSFEAVKDDLVASRDADELIAGIGQAVSVSRSKEEAGSVARALLEDRASLVGSMSRSIVEDYRQYQGDIARTASLGQLVNGKSELEHVMSITSGLYRSRLSRTGGELIEAHRTLWRMEQEENQDARVSGEGIPNWYRDLPTDKRVKLLSVRSEINRLAQDYNADIAESSWRLNDRVPGLSSEADMTLPYVASTNRPNPRLTLTREQMISRVQAMQDLLSDIRTPQGLVSRVQDAAIRHAVDRSKWFNPSDGVSSLDLSMLANGDTRIAIPEAALAEMSDVLRQRKGRVDQEEAVSEILSRHVFTREEAMDDARLAVQAVLSREVDRAKASGQVRSAESMVFRASRAVSELSDVDSLTATRLVLDAIQQVNKGEIASSQLAVEGALRHQAKVEQSMLKRRSTIAASKTDPADTSSLPGTASMLVQLTGSPDNIAIASRILAKDGEVWSRLQQGRVGRSQFRDGYDDSRAADMDADELAELGAQALSSTLQTPYSVSGDLLVPDDLQSRVRGLLAQKNGKQPTDGEVNSEVSRMKLAAVTPPTPVASTQLRPDKVNRLMAKIEASGVFTPRAAHIDKTSKIEESLGEVAPIATMRAVMADVIARLTNVAATPAGDPTSLIDQGYEVDDQGVRGDHLHAQAVRALADLDLNPSDATIEQAFKTYSKIVAFTTTNEYLDHIVAAFVDSKVITGGVIRFTLHFNARIRTAFARNLLGRTAARRILAITEYGPNGSLGFNRFESSNTAIAALMHKQLLKLGGEGVVGRAVQGVKKALHLDNRLELASDGYLFAGIKSQFDSGYGSPAQKAESLIRMFGQADDGLLLAINHTGVDTGAFKKLAKKTGVALTGESSDLLNQRLLYRKSRDKFLPIIQRVASGEITDIGSAIMLMDAAIDKRSITYGRFLEGMFSSLSTAAMASHVMMTGERASIATKPIVPMSWISFNKDWEESFERSEIADQLSVGRAKWLKPVNRVQGHGGEINLLDINGSLAPMRIAKDMLYRTMVAPAHHVQELITGTGQIDGKTGQLHFRDGEGVVRDGYISRLTRQRGGNAAHADSAAAVMSLMMQEVVRNDFLQRNPSSKLTRAAHQLSTVAIADALTSSSQFYLQPTFALFGHVFFQDNKVNWRFLNRYLAYNSKKFAEVPGRMFSAITNTDTTPRFDETKLSETFIRDKSPYIFSRTPGANDLFLSDAGRDKPSMSLTPGGNVAKVRRVLATPLSVTKDYALRGRGWGLDKTIGSAERSLIHPMFIDEVLRRKNEELLANGDPQITRYQLLTDRTIPISFGILSDSELAIDDLLGSSKQSKKARIFQPHFGAQNIENGGAIEAARGVFTLFSSVQSALAANMYAANQIRKETKRTDDPARTAEEQAESDRVFQEGKSEYRRLMATNLFQSVAYQVMKQNTVIALAAWAASLVGDGDDEERKLYEDILRKVYGLEDGVRQRNWYDPAHFITSQIIGNDLPLGYDRRSDSFSNEKFETDMKMMGLRVAKELLGQQPIVHQGLLATSLGQFGLGVGLNAGMNEILDGGMPEYVRAGLVLPEFAGGDGKGGKSDQFIDRSLYTITRWLMNDLGDQSAMLGGAQALLEPFATLSQAKDEVSGWEMARLFGTAIMPMTRDARRSLNRDLEDEVDAKVWHSYWKARR